MELGTLQLYTVGWQLVLDPTVLLLMAAGVFLGIFFGAMPGLTANMGVAILVPFTYSLSPTAAILVLVGVYIGAVYGGSIAATLINIPGTPAAIMTGFDAYPMSQRGEAGRAIGIATTASFLGGVLSALVLALLSPAIAELASRFRSQEYFSVAVMGLSVVAFVSGSNLVRGLASGLLGLFVASIGIDLVSGYPRFTFGMADLMSGVEFVAAMIGLFGISEVLEQIATGGYLNTAVQKLDRVLPSFNEVRRHAGVVLRSSVIGVVIGALPGAGATIASIVSYGQQKRFSRQPERMGTGVPEGIVAAESANNACTGGAMITMLSLGIPGDSVTAILIGALILHGVRPGPLLFTENLPLVSSIFIGLLVANVFMLLLGLWGARLFARLITISKALLLPSVVVLSTLGAYAIRNNPFDIGVMLVFGVIGFVLSRLDIPKAPMVLGIILGPLMEVNLRRSFQLHRGDLVATLNSFWTSPISMVLLALSLLILLLPWIQRVFGARRTGPESGTYRAS